MTWTDVSLVFFGALFSAGIFHWGLRTGRKQESERMNVEIFRLYQEGRVSASLRILALRLSGLTDYNEILLKPKGGYQPNPEVEVIPSDQLRPTGTAVVSPKEKP